MSDVDFPLRIDGRGRTATTDYDDHVNDLVEQVLFTAPGERVNRPDFGAGLPQMVFGPNSPELAAATQALVQGALQRWLGDVVQIEAIDAQAEESTLRVSVRYLVKRTQERRTSEFSRSV